MKPVVKLVGTDGNVFSIIGKVSKALRSNGLDKEFEDKAFNAESYDEVLSLAMEYCEIE